MGPSDIPLGETLPHEGAGGGGGVAISLVISVLLSGLVDHLESTTTLALT